MARRATWNFGLQRRSNGAVISASRCWSWRHCAATTDGRTTACISSSSREWQDNAAAFARSRALYYPYVEPVRGGGRGLLESLAEHACVIVTDWYPAYFLPAMVRAAAKKVRIRLEEVDSNGLIPIAAADRAFPVARSFRAFVQRSLKEHIQSLPDERPLAGLRRVPRLAHIPQAITKRWPPADAAMLRGGQRALSILPIDHTIAPARLRGGAKAAKARLATFTGRRTGHVRRRSESSRRRRHEPPLAIPALRPPLGARDLLRDHDARALDHASPREPSRRTTRRLVGSLASGRGLPRSARRLAGAGLQHLRAPSALRPLLVAAGLGEEHAEATPGGRAAASLLPGAARGSDDGGQCVERGAASAEDGRVVPRLPPDAVGEEDLSNGALRPPRRSSAWRT